MKYELVEMKKHGKGAIVNCSSQGGLVGIPCIGAYNASKHGVLGLTKSAALEYARQGIRINAICPGTCETPMVRQAIEQSPDHMARVIDAIPLGRVGKAEEICFECAAPLQRLCRLCHRTDLGDGRRIYGDVINNK